MANGKLMTEMLNKWDNEDEKEPVRLMESYKLQKS